MGFTIADCEAAVGAAVGSAAGVVGAGAGVGGSGSSPPEHAKNITEAKAAAAAKMNNTPGKDGLFTSGVARFLIDDSGKDSA